ncbi:MAG: DUF934 domain-containing protein [Agarilytica sp.]
MQKLIKDGALATNEWSLAATEEFSADQLSEGKWIIPLNLYNDLAKDQHDLSQVGVWLASDDDVHQLKEFVSTLPIIAIKFAAFADGRSFSQARTLREQLDYTGEIRAVGEYIQDQMFFLARCGVNAFLLPEGTCTESALESLADFNERYQAACDEPQPLFRRRV